VKADGEDGCKLPASSGDVITGVTMAVPLTQPDANGDRKTPVTGVCSVMRSGPIWVEVEQTVAKGDPVYVRHTANGAGKDPGQFRKDSDGSVGVYPQTSLTLSGALDAGQKRIERMTFDADLVTSNVFNVTVFGVAIDSITFNGDHNVTMSQIADAIIEAGADDLLSATLSDMGGTNRAIDVVSMGNANTAILAGSVVTAGASQAGVTEAQVQAGAAGHTLTLDVDGDTVTAPWAGSHDATVHSFAEELAGHPKVAAAEVTHVLAGNDLVITLTGANYAADDIDLANGNPTGGATARTGAINNEVVAGVAVSSKASLFTGGRYAKGAAAGKTALLELFGN